MTFAATTREPQLNGTAQHTRVIQITPEYANATLAASGTNNSGNMTGSFCSGSSKRNFQTSICTVATEEHTFYQWNPTVASPAQTYDIYARFPIPSDFASLTSISMAGWRTGASDSVTLAIYDGTSSGTLCGAATNMATGTATWTTPSYTVSTCTLNAGETALFKITMSATSTSDFARAGEITFTYKSKW